MTTAESIETAMRRALELAAHGPLTGGNPRVGCVLLDADGATVAEGWHHGAGTPHAEVDALSKVGDATGLTAVVTLEPCNHTGRTGPCSEALIAAGVSRVVYALDDPGESEGGGAERLREAGIEVVGGVLATELVLQQPADGHTLLLVDNGMAVYSPALYARLPFNPDTALTGVGLIARFPIILIVRNENPIRDWAGFLAAARSRPPSFGSGAVASPQHLAMEYLSRRAGFSATHVPYRNSPAAVQDLVAGQIDCMLTDSASAMGTIRQGQTRALAVMTAARLPALPDVPSFRELGVDVTDAYAWMGLSVAAATPAPVVARLNTALTEAIASEEVAQMIRNLSAEAVPGDAAAFNAQIRAEAAVWRPLIRDLGIRLD